MATPIPAVRFLRQWHGFAPGATSTSLGTGVALLLIQRGFCERADAPPAEPKTAKKTTRRGKI